MLFKLKWIVLPFAFLIVQISVSAQDVQFENTAGNDTVVEHEEVGLIVEKIADSLFRYYVHLDEGIKIGEVLKNKFKKGDYDAIKKPEILADSLTADLRSFNGDKHLSVSFRPINEVQSSNAINNPAGAATNFGFTKVEFLEGNIALVKIAHFSTWSYIEGANEVASKVMALVQHADAIIFDVRDNRGGVPYLVSYLISYLFDGPRIHLTEYVHRFNNGGYGIYTESDIPGRRLPDAPVFVVTNNRTASAAEEFADWLKHLNRATIIGEVTTGAGYGAMSHRLNDRFIVSISSEEGLNAVTNESLEKVGVIPHILTSSIRR